MEFQFSLGWGEIGLGRGDTTRDRATEENEASLPPPVPLLTMHNLQESDTQITEDWRYLSWSLQAPTPACTLDRVGVGGWRGMFSYHACLVLRLDLQPSKPRMGAQGEGWNKLKASL